MGGDQHDPQSYGGHFDRHRFDLGHIDYEPDRFIVKSETVNIKLEQRGEKSCKDLQGKTG